jgi:hypothetical protein
MKNEHATCQANDIKQKRLLGGNLAQKEKKSDLLSFSLSSIFLHFNLFSIILLCSFAFISTLKTMLCFKCGGIGRILVFFVVL